MGGWIFLEVPLIIFYNKTTKSVKRLSDNLLPEKAMRPIGKQRDLSQWQLPHHAGQVQGVFEIFKIPLD